MANIPQSVAQFLGGKRIAVAGVSRSPDQAANAVYRKLKDSGYEVFAINPNADVVEGDTCYPNIASIPGQLDGMVIATHPQFATEIVRECSERGVNRVWFHRAFGDGSVSEEAVNECEARGIDCIVGGCPLMFCEPIDFGHKCMKWWLQWRHHVPT